jgi:hypothetical protein
MILRRYWLNSTANWRFSQATDGLRRRGVPAIRLVEKSDLKNNPIGLNIGYVDQSD